jgi:hypothetical protein
MGNAIRAALLTALVTGVAIPAVATIVDQIAVAVGNKVITDSEIRERIRLTAFENGDSPDFSLASRQVATQRLIEQKLVEREMEVGHYPHLVAVRAEQLLADFIRDNYQNNQASFDSAVARVGLMSSEVRDDLIRQADLLTFLDLRFRPAVEVTPEDVRKYFDQNIGPKAGAEAFEQMRTQIEQELAGERSDAQLNAWLEDQRKRTKIEYVEKELEHVEKEPGENAPQ